MVQPYPVSSVSQVGEPGRPEVLLEPDREAGVVADHECRHQRALRLGPPGDRFADRRPDRGGTTPPHVRATDAHGRAGTDDERRDLTLVRWCHPADGSHLRTEG